MEILLGSGSERRKRILSFFSLPFKQVVSGFDEESVPFTGSVEEYVSIVAKKKCEVLAKKHPKDIILTADTAVAVHKKLFTKPENEEQAIRILYEISGSWHEVFTGVCVFQNGVFHAKTEVTKILFHPMNDQEIATYHDKCYFPDAAGGYDISGKGIIIVKQIDGCFHNIMGLPINVTRELLLKVGINLWDFLG